MENPPIALIHTGNLSAAQAIDLAIQLANTSLLKSKTRFYTMFEKHTHLIDYIFNNQYKIKQLFMKTVIINTLHVYKPD